MTDKHWSIAVDAQQIYELSEDKRYADIVEPSPEYRIEDINMGGASQATQDKLKLIANVKLCDGKLAEYYINRTSARYIANRLNTDLTAAGMKGWVGYRIYWGQILDQMIGGKVKKVLYVTKVEKAPIFV